MLRLHSIHFWDAKPSTVLGKRNCYCGLAPALPCSGNRVGKSNWGYNSRILEGERKYSSLEMLKLHLSACIAALPSQWRASEVTATGTRFCLELTMRRLDACGGSAWPEN